MPGLIVAGQQIDVPGLTILNYKDDPAYGLPSRDYGKRGDKRVRLIVVHSTEGIPSIPGKPGWENAAQVIRPGLGPKLAQGTIDSWSHSSRVGAAALVLGQDATWICACDLDLSESYHAQTVNGISVGIEVVQGHDASFYQGQLDALLPMLDALTAIFSIQRQFHGPYRAWKPPLRLQNSGGQGKDCCGIIGHRDQTDGRGPGDPGDWLSPILRGAGYEEFDFDKRTDIQAWQARQADLGFSPEDCDGQPGPKTCAALLAQKGVPLWIARPVDGQVPVLSDIIAPATTPPPATFFGQPVAVATLSADDLVVMGNEADTKVDDGSM